MREQVLEGRRAGAAEDGDLVRDRSTPARGLLGLRRRLPSAAASASRRASSRGRLLRRRLLLAPRSSSSRRASSSRPWRRRARPGPADLAARASASASGSPALVTLHVEVELGAAVPAPERLRTPEQQRAALRARPVLLGRVVHREVALGVPIAPVERPEPRALLDDLALVALRAR